MKYVKSTLVAGLAMLLLSFVLSFMCQALFNYDIRVLPGMRNQNDPLMLLFFLLPFVFSAGMSLLFKRFKGTGVELGLATWMLFSVPSAIIIFATMDYPIGFIVNQVVGGLGMFIPGGMLVERMGKG